MNGIENPIIFYPAAFFILLFAGLAIKFKNIFYALLSAIAVFFLAGLIFYELGSEYNAVVQILIYGIAVPVILGLGIMFTNTKSDNKEPYSDRLRFYTLLAFGLFILAVIYLVMTSIIVVPEGFNILEETSANSSEVINAFAQGVFVKYVWAFELISLILTITAVGLTIFNYKNRNKIGGQK